MTHIRKSIFKNYYTIPYSDDAIYFKLLSNKLTTINNIILFSLSPMIISIILVYSIFSLTSLRYSLYNVNELTITGLLGIFALLRKLFFNHDNKEQKYSRFYYLPVDITFYVFTFIIYYLVRSNIYPINITNVDDFVRSCFVLSAFIKFTPEVINSTILVTKILSERLKVPFNNTSIKYMDRQIINEIFLIKLMIGIIKILLIIYMLDLQNIYFFIAYLLLDFFREEIMLCYLDLEFDRIKLKEYNNTQLRRKTNE